MSNKHILITGATGFLGADIMKRILSDTKDDKVYIIARDKNGTSAQKRVAKILDGDTFLNSSKVVSRKVSPSSEKRPQQRIEIFEGDISESNLGLDKESFGHLADEIDEIYHCAAITDLTYPLDEIRKVNVKGTENILNLALKAKKLKKVFHISTAYIVGTKKCIFKESDLNIGQSFNNTYEQSKYEAELLVNEYRKRGVNITVFRPSIITGNSKTGETSNFKMFYKPLHFLSEEIFTEIPTSGNTSNNFVPIDKVAEAIYLIASDKEANGQAYHITNTKEVNLDYFVTSASEFFGFKKPHYVLLKDFDINSLTPVQRKIIEPYIPYFNYETKFDASSANKILKKYNFSFPDYDRTHLNRIFEYCVTSGFIKIKKKVERR
jgi:long-chain acyl-CoA synthetase